MVDRIANEIIVASHIMHTNNLSTIASDLGYQPMLILNALFQAESDGKLKYVKKKDIIKISEDVNVDSLAMTDGLIESREQVEMFISNQNSIEVDMSFDELRQLLPILPELHMKIALYTSKLLAEYEIADPKDKESVYKFYTLKENKDKFWGSKQFSTTDSKIKKIAKKVTKGKK